MFARILLVIPKGILSAAKDLHPNIVILSNLHLDIVILSAAKDLLLACAGDYTSKKRL